jgi:hypothetical protein
LVSALPDFRQQNGQICETLLTEWLLRRGFYVCRPLAGQGPVDVIAYNDGGQFYFLDAKQDSVRTVKDRKKPVRIHRPLSATQRLLNVRVAYVNIDTGEVHIVPPLEEDES